MPEIITIGETMAAMAPQDYGPLRYVKGFQPRIAGAESNVAIGLARLGHSVAWISRLGADEFGEYVFREIRAEGVDVSGVQFDPDHRTGVMFKERRFSGETSVYYYRENSAASHMDGSAIDGNTLKAASIVHLTGITPVLSESCLAMTREIIRRCATEGICLSFDPNIRRTLWRGRDYTKDLREMTLAAQIVLMGEEEAGLLFGDKTEEEWLDLLFTKGNARYVAIKRGSRGAVVADGHSVVIPPFHCHCVDPVGAGDGFNAGFLAGILEGRDLKTCGQMGAVVGAKATETTGDVEGYPSRRQLDQLLNHQAEVYR